MLIVKVAQNDTPLTHPAKIIRPGGQQDHGRGVVLHVQEEVYQSTLTFRRKVADTKNDAFDPSSKNFDFLY